MRATLKTRFSARLAERKIDAANRHARAYAASANLRTRESAADDYLHGQEMARARRGDARLALAGFVCLALLFWLWLLPMIVPAAQNAGPAMYDAARVLHEKGR